MHRHDGRLLLSCVSRTWHTRDTHTDTQDPCHTSHIEPVFALHKSGSGPPLSGLWDRRGWTRLCTVDTSLSLPPLTPDAPRLYAHPLASRVARRMPDIVAQHFRSRIPEKASCRRTNRSLAYLQSALCTMVRLHDSMSILPEERPSIC